MTIPELIEKRFGPNIRWAAGVVIVLGGLLNMGVFLRVAPFRERLGIKDDDLLSQVEHGLRKYFGRQSEPVVEPTARRSPCRSKACR